MPYLTAADVEAHWKLEKAQKLHKAIELGSNVSSKQMAILRYDSNIAKQYAENVWPQGTYKRITINEEPKFNVTAQAEIES